MGKRDELTPEDFLAYLQKKVPGFRRESDRHRLALARMLWVGSTSKRRQHSHYGNQFSFAHTELNAMFGRGKFTEVNTRLNLFVVTPWSAERGYTKGFALAPRTKDLVETYLDNVHRRPVTSLLYETATGIQKCRSAPDAVASRDMEGITTTAWRRAKRLNDVRVDLHALWTLQASLIRARNTWRKEGQPPRRLFGDPSLESIERLIDAVGRVLRMARTDVLGEGRMVHRYCESGSGRLYGVGVTLQNIPAPIKQAALNGQWEYDFSNCHYAILDQMAARFGHDCTAVRHYLANKKAVRQQIADEAGITPERAKECLLATLYGARAALSWQHAIPAAIGKEAAARLYRTGAFREIKEDIQTARRKILAGWPTTRNGWLKNDFGKSIRATDSPEERLAHLIQGVEAKALKTVIDMHPDQIVLTQHDGWVSIDRLNVPAIEGAVQATTGYLLTLEENRIYMDLDSYFGRAEKQNATCQKVHSGQGLTPLSGGLYAN